MLAILEYGAGNQTSVLRALRHLDIPAKITADPEDLAACEGIIFPGVGAAAQAMERLKSSCLDVALRNAAQKGQPILGICLGCQILLEHSAEGNTDTLSILPGQCLRFDPDLKDENGETIKIPHMGWNGITVKKPCPLLQGVDPDAEFYFVHSYFVAAPEQYVLATTVHGLEFCSICGRDGLWGVQFHPEKSGRPGLAILANFYNYCLGKNHAL